MERPSYQKLKHFAQRTIASTVGVATLVGSVAGGQPQSPQAAPDIDQGVAVQLIDAVKAHNAGQFPGGKLPDGKVAPQDIAAAFESLKESNADCAIVGAATRNPKTGAIDSGLIAVKRDADGKYTIMQTTKGALLATANDSDTYRQAFGGSTPETNLAGGKSVAISAQGYADPLQCKYIQEMAEKNVPGVYAPPAMGITNPLYKEPVKAQPLLQAQTSPQGKFSVRGGTGGISFS